MSRKEELRRQMLRHVMLESWRMYRRGLSICHSWSSCLKLAWAKVRGRVRMLSTRVYGSSFTNDNGISRQTILARLARLPRFMVGVALVREPENPHDPNAIRIVARVRGADGSFTLGYLKKELAAGTAPLMDAGAETVARFDGVTGGFKGKSFGCSFSYALIGQKEKAAR